METFFSFLARRIDDCSSLLCVGLDPHRSDLPTATAESALDYCVNIVRQTGRYAAAFKPNSAFFEQFGSQGWVALELLIESIHEESNRLGSHIPVILDAKRGDIASTTQAYAESVFGHLKADAVTLNPYLGKDSIVPFLENQEKGVFLVCKTSNPGSGYLQDLWANGSTVYEHVARLGQALNERGNVGLVVGATHPQALKYLRLVVPDLWFLVPGVGVQGGEMEAILQNGLREDNRGLLINVSRSIAQAENPGTVAASLRDQMLDYLHADRKKVRQFPENTHLHGLRAWLADELLATGSIKFGEFTLKSGLKSPIYIDLRQLVSFPSVLSQVASAYQLLLRNITFTRLAALPYAAIPIGTTISLQMGLPLIYPRKEVKAYGTKADIEGLYVQGEKVVVIDDLATTGETKFEAIQKLKDAGLEVSDIVVLIDRQSGAKESLAEAGYQLHAVLKLEEMLDHWEQNHTVASEKIEAVRRFMMRD